MRAGRSIAVAFEPLGMGFQRLFISVVAIHSRNDTQVALGERGRHLAEQIARAQELAAMMIRNLCGIECYDAAPVDQHRINFERCPVVSPLVHIHSQWVTLIKVDLAAPAHHCVPGPLTIGCLHGGFARLWSEESSADIFVGFVRRYGYYRCAGNGEKFPARYPAPF